MSRNRTGARTWSVCKLNHADGDPWYQINFKDGEREIGPICEFKYLLAGEEQIKTDARFIVLADHHFDAMENALRNLRYYSIGKIKPELFAEANSVLQAIENERDTHEDS